MNQSDAAVPAISVCICTYKRPQMLHHLLLKLAQQETEGRFVYSIVIVDNDRLESARPVAESFARLWTIPLSYHVEPEQNIARARNRAIENAKGNLVALIDDDEFPEPRWLLTLLHAMDRFGADGILAPVLPHFETKPPNWVLKGRFFDRPTHPTGHVLDWTNTRTGNTLLQRKLFANRNQWFDPAYGSGGEDRDFFRRAIKEGFVLVWCQEAFVFETVPPARWKRSTLLKRALLRGKVALGSTAGPVYASIAKSAAAVTIYTAALPLCLLFGQHVFMRYLIKDCDHLGKLLAFLGIDPVKEKYVGG